MANYLLWSDKGDLAVIDPGTTLSDINLSQ